MIYSAYVLQHILPIHCWFALIEYFSPTLHCHSVNIFFLPGQPAEPLVSSFNDFFVQKIERIRKDLDEQAGNIPQDIPEHDTERAVTSLTSFSPVSVQDIEKILSSASGASCAFDPSLHGS